MKKLCKFPDIEQYRQLIQYVKERTQYIGKDDNGNALFDESIILPTLTFTGTVKLHGTNSSITLSKDGDIYAQSREQILSIKEDNSGFASFLEENKEVFKQLLSSIDMKDYDYVSVFGEWCGKGIQKGVAINKLEKMFVIFDIKLSYDDNLKGDNYYLPISEIVKLRSVENRIFNIYDFKTYEVDIDFNNPKESLDILTNLTLEVEKECPVAKEFGIDGVGEGIVFTHQTIDNKKYRFKVKGDKFKSSSSKERKIVEVDIEKVNNINEFVEYTVTESRLNQGIEKIYGFNQPLDIKKTGDFLRWVFNDIIKEESDTLIGNGLTSKDVSSAISNKARLWLFDKINTF